MKSTHIAFWIIYILTLAFFGGSFIFQEMQNNFMYARDNWGGIVMFWLTGTSFWGMFYSMQLFLDSLTSKRKPKK